MASLIRKLVRQQWLAAFIWAIILLVLSTIPSNRLPKVRNWTDLIGIDKVAHLLVYAVFAVLLYLPLRKRRTNAWFWSVFLAASYGVGMELLQAVMPTGRGYDPADMLANVIGAFLGVLVFRWIYPILNENELLKIFKPKSK